MIQGQTFQQQTFVTPAKAGGHHRLSKFGVRVMDSRLRGNDEVLVLVHMLELEGEL